MTKNEIAAIKIVEEFLKDELDDYSCFNGWKIEESEESGNNIYVETSLGVSFKVKDKTLFVELGEDCWQEVVTYDWTVKYFWMALLSWDKI